MEVAFLACFLLIFCSKSLISLGVEDFPTSNYVDLNLSEPKFEGRLHVRNAGVNVTTRVYAERGLDEKQDDIVSKKGAKGKGTYGAGNIDRRPRTNKGSISLSSSIYFYVTTATLNASSAALMALLLLGVF